MEKQNPYLANAEEAQSEYRFEQSFAELGLSPDILKGIEEAGYEVPTLVQGTTIPKAIAGQNLLVRSRTGTGKTAAFGLPLLNQAEAGVRQHQSLVLCPTRELAIQVGDELARLSAHKDLMVTCIYGGVPYPPQLKALKAGAEIVVGTPGRVLDHIRKGNLKLDTVRFTVLDEADEMLSMGFLMEVTNILEGVPKDGQMLLFSASVEEDIQNLMRRFMGEPEVVMLSTDTRLVAGVEHIIYEGNNSYPKPRQLLFLLEDERPESAIVFCNTRVETTALSSFLSQHGIEAAPISSILNQKARESVMRRIRERSLKVLVATDIAARGIDISHLTHVINYSLPEDPAIYLHRTGRTGRIGRTGRALSLQMGKQLNTRRILEREFGLNFTEKTLPTPEEANKLSAMRHLEELAQWRGETTGEAHRIVARRLLAHPSAEMLAALLLKGHFSWGRSRPPGDYSDVATAPTEEEQEDWVEDRIDDIKGAVRRTAFEGYLGVGKQLREEAEAEELLATALVGFHCWWDESDAGGRTKRSKRPRSNQRQKDEPPKAAVEAPKAAAEAPKATVEASSTPSATSEERPSAEPTEAASEAGKPRRKRRRRSRKKDSPPSQAAQAADSAGVDETPPAEVPSASNEDPPPPELPNVLGADGEEVDLDAITLEFPALDIEPVADQQPSDQTATEEQPEGAAEGEGRKRRRRRRRGSSRDRGRKEGAKAIPTETETATAPSDPDETAETTRPSEGSGAKEIVISTVWEVEEDASFGHSRAEALADVDPEAPVYDERDRIPNISGSRKRNYRSEQVTGEVDEDAPKTARSKRPARKQATSGGGRSRSGRRGSAQGTKSKRSKPAATKSTAKKTQAPKQAEAAAPTEPAKKRRRRKAASPSASST